jgi:molybdopterin-guanine dinucleotide biosynthesis protein A
MLVGVIIAGGRGTRLGTGEKPLVPFGTTTLIGAVISRARPQVELLALNVRLDAVPLYEDWRREGFPLLVDAGTGEGPLRGVVSGLEWLSSLGTKHGWLATFPADTPFLPLDLVGTLLAQAPDRSRPVVAHDGARFQSLCALWPRDCLVALQRELAASRSVRDALLAVDAQVCSFQDERAFFNVNGPDDLLAARHFVRS